MIEHFVSGNLQLLERADTVSMKYGITKCSYQKTFWRKLTGSLFVLLYKQLLTPLSSGKSYIDPVIGHIHVYALPDVEALKSKIHVKFHVSKHGSYNLAPDWMTAVLSANQMPGLKIFVN